MTTPIDASAYYDAFPSNDHVPGDIWSHLPTFGILQIPHCAGLIITPACDLANRKVESITYVPVLSIEEYFGCREVVADLLRATDGQLQAAGISLKIRGDSISRPTEADIVAIQDLLTESMTRMKSQKELLAAKRAADGLALLRGILTGSSVETVINQVESLFGAAEFASICKRVVTNGYRTDIHFLPADGQRPTWSAIARHSVAMFRYPLTVPLEILDLSTTLGQGEWNASARRLSDRLPAIKHIAERQPIKLLRVRPRFISDLLTRFVALYARLGAPDFSAGMVESYTEEILGRSL